MSKTCFVIAPIGDTDSDIRRRSDQILKYVIQPAAKVCGYDEAIRADQISEPGIITSQIINHVIEDPMVVADLTGRNPNVFYELAVRHALRKPYVQLIQRGERIPFDVAGIRTIEIDHRDLDSVEVSRAEMIKQMQAMDDRQHVDSPISGVAEQRSSTATAACDVRFSLRRAGVGRRHRRDQRRSRCRGRAPGFRCTRRSA